MAEGHHIIPKKTLYAVFGGLIFLTVLTVLTATQLDLGVLNVPLALAIAGTKAFLVVAFFMGLKYDSPVNVLTFSIGTIFVVVFLVFTLFDTLFRGDLGNVDPITVEERIAQDSLLRMREPNPDELRVAPADFMNTEAEAESVEDEAAATMEAAAEDAQDLRDAAGVGEAGAEGLEQAPEN